MSSLSSKSTDELSKLLDEYGLKHGPIVDSTRKLYEKKLAEAMAKNKKPSSDKTYYREEEEEITYVTYHQPVKHEGSGDLTRRSKTMEYTDEVENAYDHGQSIYQSVSRPAKTAYTSVPDRGATKSEGNKTGGVPGWLRLLVFILIAVILYYVYSNMEPTDENPFKEIEE